MEEPVFPLNMPAVRRYELDLDERFTLRQLEDIDHSLTRLFGTPDEPCLPDEETITAMLDPDMLVRAAGPVQDEAASGAGQGGRGLYRRHCAHCHGTAGDGAGPAAAWMNPYPRDFRPGVFQYKSTPIGARPTDDDLRRIIVRGASGTAMPAFTELADDDIEPLVQYVKYLAIRGETELVLIHESADLNVAARERLDKSDEFLIEEVVAVVAEIWAEAEGQVVEVPPRPDMAFAASARLGRDIYFSEVGGCVKCHGPTGLGDGQDTYYDYWSERLDPSKPERVAQYLAVGALPPRRIVPHNLRTGVYRGGRRPVDLFWRIRSGIEGTPMPVASMKAPGASEDAVGLTGDQVWHLVDYVRSLPFENVNRVDGAREVAAARGRAASSEPVLARVTVRQFEWQVQYPGKDGQWNTLDDLYAVNELRVPQGDDSAILITSGDVRHAVRLPESAARRTLVPGQPQRVRIAASQSGTYRMLRNERVGWGHPPVQAVLIVEPREKWKAALERMDGKQDEAAET
jgi:mono/diheme cytochrome c family protein